MSVIKLLTVESTEEIVDFIDNLNRTENLGILCDIFLIFSRNNINYTHNNNGYYIKMGDIDPNTLEELVRFINFTINNRRVIKQRQMDIAVSIAASKIEKSRSSEIDTESVSDNESEEDTSDPKIFLKRKRQTFNKAWSQLLKDCRGTKSKKCGVLVDKDIIEKEEVFSSEESASTEQLKEEEEEESYNQSGSLNGSEYSYKDTSESSSC